MSVSPPTSSKNQRIVPMLSLANEDLHKRNSTFFTEVMKRQQEAKRRQKEDELKLTPAELQLRREAEEESRKHEAKRLEHYTTMGAFHLSPRASMSFCPQIPNHGNPVAKHHDMVFEKTRSESNKRRTGRYSNLLRKLFPDILHRK